MAWQQITFALAAAETGRAESLLQLAGAVAVTLGDDRDDPVLEPPPGAVELWPHVRLTALFDDDADAEAIAALIAEALDADSVDIARLEDDDWIAGWQQTIEPIEVAPGLRIAPAGHGDEYPTGSTVLLNMGLAFGTGRHPTTRLCLEWLAAGSMTGLDVLDYGCGSGVLALAALKRGARRGICVDNDEQALIATRANAALNGVADRVHTSMPEALTAQHADLIVANILAGTLQSLVPILAARQTTGGRLVLSGILAEQAETVIDAFSSDYSGFEVAELDGWVRIAAHRR